MEGFLFQAMIYLGAAVLAVPLAARLGLGSVLGYLAAGIVIGPILGLVGAETQDLQHFAEFGVVMMLFLIGLELEPKALWEMRDRLIAGGGLQVVLTTLAIAGTGVAFGLAWQTALVVGMIFALSSTAIVLQTLTEKRLMETPGGRNVFSVLLTQDIAVIPMLALLPLLAVAPAAAPEGAEETIGPASEEVEAARTLIEGLPAWAVTLVTLGAVLAVVLAGIYLTRPVFRWIHHTRLRELYTALGLLMVVSIAVLMELVGLSPALGTFLAGVVLASSEWRHELESDLEPFKGLLLGLFFITVGAGIDFQVLMQDPLRIAVLTAAVIGIKGAVLYLLARMFRMRTRERWLYTLALAQAGEFGFVLTSFSVAQGVLTEGDASTMLLVIALSMLITPLLFILYGWLASQGEEAEEPEPDHIDRQGPIIVAGIGRFGQVVSRLVMGAGYDTVLLDSDMAMIETMRRFGFRGFFGDPARPDILHAAGLEKAKVLVVALDDPQASLRLIAHARSMRPDLHIVARAYDREHVYQLHKAGADDIVREMFDSSLRAGRYVLERMGLSEADAAEAQAAYYRHDRNAVKQLAELWQPGVPVAQNAAYVRHSKELNRELETQILAGMSGGNAEGGETAQGEAPSPDARSPGSQSG
ncbi:monovalent cation:proton antiporter-2 (CPA2) family protein [Pseudoroseicyclus aestuarii]|uniref:Kef-type potassium/proton antiporter (CPA2 family) n=1 Tax=Pseudoroseicyclus aestuarii TaxID=1795041 RepID=A0A318SSU7_9RHOB|nr:monovalent cation:proton antiporter-2 (CPA2) family protein [Pseudoroseicyclus aestuarii]PYE82362.1 Kef-type potassium/proton antiporter (CPA2 family) [Pseudoroseicyclus aestuarii]